MTNGRHENLPLAGGPGRTHAMWLLPNLSNMHALWLCALHDTPQSRWTAHRSDEAAAGAGCLGFSISSSEGLATGTPRLVSPSENARWAPPDAGVLQTPAHPSAAAQQYELPPVLAVWLPGWRMRPMLRLLHAPPAPPSAACIRHAGLSVLATLGLLSGQKESRSFFA